MPLIKRKHNSIEGYVQDWLEPDDGGINFFSGTIIVLVIASLMSLAFETELLREDTHLDRSLLPLVQTLNVAVVWIFAVEFALRFWSEGENAAHKGFIGRVRFLTQPVTIADVLAFAPELIAMLLFPDYSGAFFPAQRALRLFRLFKLARYVPAFAIVGAAVKRAWAPLMAALCVAAAQLYIAAMLLSVNREYLARGVAALDADPAVAAVGGRRIGVARTASGAAVATALSSKFGVGDSINHYALSAQDTDHASFGVFRVTVLRAVGGWDESLLVNVDLDLDHRILGQGHRIRFDPQMCIYWHVRESVPALARQYRRYGRGKAAMVLKNGLGAVRLRHLAPPALVVALGLAVVCAVLGWWPLALLLSVPYLLAVLAAAVIPWRPGVLIDPPPSTHTDASRTGASSSSRAPP